MSYILTNQLYIGEAFAFRTKRVKTPGREWGKVTRLPPEEWLPLPAGIVLLDDLTYGERCRFIGTIRLETRVYKADHSPRWEGFSAIPIRAAADQTGHDSRLNAWSQNMNS